ncbi:MAG TPA: hypothetical protein PLK90_10680 [Clostridiales bacterium]|jgi:hypothetical protein|nr:hypothetical protein [Clostridiales bacterium]HQP70854.1 hypothetical protein [Clostridiales bacterium]
MQDELKLNKSVIKITPFNSDDEKEYWARKSPAERLEALEINRKIVYGYRDDPPRLQRFLEIVKQPWS